MLLYKKLLLMTFGTTLLRTAQWCMCDIPFFITFLFTIPVSTFLLTNDPIPFLPFLVKLSIYDFLPKTLRNKIVLRTLYSEWISVNFVIKLYFEFSPWTRPKKHRESQERHIVCVRLYYCKVSRWSARLSAASIQYGQKNTNFWSQTDVLPQRTRL